MYLPANRAAAGDVVITRAEAVTGRLPGAHQIVYPTFDQAMDVARAAHLAARRASAWSQPGEASGPVLHLDTAKTEALIAELTRKGERGAAARVSAPALNYLGP